MKAIDEQQHLMLVRRMDGEVLAMEQCLSNRDTKRITRHLQAFSELMEELLETEPTEDDELLFRIAALVRRRDAVERAVHDQNMQRLLAKVMAPCLPPVRGRFTRRPRNRGRGH